MTNSRLPGFYRLDLEERRRLLTEGARPDTGDARRDTGDARRDGRHGAGSVWNDARSVWDGGGLSAAQADHIVENALGIYALPLGVALNAVINGRDRLIPMVVEEPSVIAAASNACRMVREGGGFSAEVPEALMIAQIELRSVADVRAATQAITEQKERLFDLARDAVPGLVRRGGGPRDLEVRTLAPDHLVVHVLLDCCDAMGANLANTTAERLGPRLAQLAQAEVGLCILSNLSDRRMVHVEGRVPFSALTDGGRTGEDAGKAVAEAIQGASVFAERDPYRAATHNKGIMNGIDSVVIATGNDYRAVEAGAHAFAAQGGTYAPLATWRCEGDALVGRLRLPLALGTVGGTLRVHAGAQLSLALAEVTSAGDLACLAGAAGLASNLAALRALATDGIQKGHMALHARSVALAVGARGDEVDLVARAISEAGKPNETAALEALQKLRGSALEQRRGS